jgi:GNAT superfamily N-acetyltransferase
MDALLRLAGPDDTSAVSRVLVESRLAFLPYAPSAHSPPEVRQWVADHLIPTGTVHVAQVGAEVAAVLAMSEQSDYGWIDQLYVLPGYNGRGIGSKLLLLAHTALRRPIRLYTFQANSGARRFYERHGYEAIQFTDGSSNEERCPDVLYEFNALRTEA